MKNRTCGVVAAGLFGAFLSQSAYCEPVQLRCDLSFVQVSATSHVEAENACDIVRESDAAFRKLGLNLTEKIVIEVTENFGDASGQCVALFNTEQNLIQVLPMHCLDNRPGRLGPFPDLGASVYFESLIVHELAHAYVDQNGGERFIPRIAHEYLAYAIQLDQLPESERGEIMDQSGVSDPVELADINEAVLNLSPLRFAAMSWLHFKSFGGDKEAVRRVLEGEVIFRSHRE